MERIRIGTRGSQLALYQANVVAAFLKNSNLELEIEIVLILVWVTMKMIWMIDIR